MTQKEALEALGRLYNPRRYITKGDDEDMNIVRQYIEGQGWQPIMTLNLDELDEVFILVTGKCKDGVNRYVSEVWVNDGKLYEFNMSIIEISDITHWMKKPQPPSGEE